jgi:hypothetical protein
LDGSHFKMVIFTPVPPFLFPFVLLLNHTPSPLSPAEADEEGSFGLRDPSCFCYCHSRCDALLF